MSERTGKIVMQEEARRLLEDFLFISADEYLALYPEAGFTRVAHPFGMRYSVIRNCLCAGEEGQIVMPPGGRDGRSFVLKESFNHEHSGDLLALAIGSALLHADKTEPVVLDEAVPLYPLWSLGNLWHWLFESAPKVCAMEAAGYTGPYIANASSSVVREGLALLGVGPGRLVHCATPHLVRRALLPHVIHWSVIHEHRTLLLACRERMLEAAGRQAGEKRCFIRRIGERKLLNEEELLDALRSYEIEVLVPEEHSLAGQISFISNSILTLSPHGANTGLALFQKSGSVLMEFFGHDHINNVCNLAIIKNIRLLYLPVTQTVMTGSPVGSGKSQSGLADYRVNPDLAAAMLDNLRSGTYHL